MNDPTPEEVPPNAAQGKKNAPTAPPTEEIGGTENDPTRFGDWQHKGRVTDF